MSKRHEIAEFISRKVQDFRGYNEEDPINESSSFSNDLGADSLDILCLVMECEKEFSISIPPGETDKVSKVGDLVDLVESKL